MRRIQAQLETMDIGGKWDPKSRDVSEPKEEAQVEAEHISQEPVEIRFLRSILRESLRLKSELPVYVGSLAAKNLIEWINDLDKYFEYDEVKENKKARFVVTKLKGHTSLWWDNM